MSATATPDIVVVHRPELMSEEHEDTKDATGISSHHRASSERKDFIVPLAVQSDAEEETELAYSGPWQRS